MKKYLIIIMGPTAVGKTSISIDIAKYFNTEIISCDSRQIYKELCIGTAVPSKSELEAVRHYFIQNKSIHDYYNASMYETEVIDLLTELFKIKDKIIVTGGSGLYVNAICNGIDDLPSVNHELREELIERYKNEGIEYIRKQLKLLDPVYYAEVDLKNPKRILKALEICIMTGKPYSAFLTKSKKERFFKSVKIGLNTERDILYEQINRRVDQMINSGLIEEVKKLNLFKKLNSLNTVGYKELFDFFDGKTSLDEAVDLIKRNSRNYARRQLTWFRKDKEIKWFMPADTEEIIQYINNYIRI